MIAKRVIPCLDVHDGQVTRGVQFGVAEKGGLRNVGDPVELALRYNEQGADEMVFFDITATAHGRGTMVDVIERAADQCFMPLTVGGGIKSVEDMFTMLRAGADKISINSSALANPELIRQGAEKFGSQCIVVSIDAKKIGPDKWGVFSHGGRKDTGLDAIEWIACRVVAPVGVAVSLNSRGHALKLVERELRTQARSRLASEFTFSSPLQLAGGACLPQLGPTALRIEPGKPVLGFARLDSASAKAFPIPTVLVTGLPISCPVPSVNWANAYCAATVEISLTVTLGNLARLVHWVSALISPMNGLLFPPAWPPTAVT